MSKEVANVLRSALAKLGPNGEFWAKDDDKFHTDSFCSSTAISTQATGLSAVKAREVLCSIVGVSNEQCEYLWVWNDAPERTWADVKSAYEKAILMAEAGQ